MTILRRRILNLFAGLQSAHRTDVLRMFSEAEQDAAQAELDSMVRDGLLREQDGRLWPAKAP